ncbi:hypothetical protein D5086_001916 [Populus alba]|uniref:Uncharacterized protein n=1 Tax=Populus alba TaxID=43335 RepID=A0ACC4D2B4_POPAL
MSHKQRQELCFTFQTDSSSLSPAPERSRTSRNNNPVVRPVSSLHQQLVPVVSRESIGKKRKTEINTKYQHSSLSSESVMTGCAQEKLQCHLLRLFQRQDLQNRREDKKERKGRRHRAERRRPTQAENKGKGAGTDEHGQTSQHAFNIAAAPSFFLQVRYSILHAFLGCNLLLFK